MEKREMIKKDYLLSNIRIGIQPVSDDRIIKKESGYKDVEKYLYLKVSDEEDGSYTAKLNESMLRFLKVNDEEAWKAAEKNTFCKTKIRSLVKVLAELMSCEESCVGEIGPEMYIVTNEDGVKGAANILDEESLRRFFEDRKINRYIVLPSSIHEMIVVPDDGKMKLDEMTEMVRSINLTQVKPEDRLADQAYIRSF